MNKRIAIDEGDGNQGTIIPALPHHVICKILVRLPLKTLMRFKAVSKEWLYTIHDQSLATEFLIHRSQIHTTAPTFLIYLFRSNLYYSIDLDSGLATPFENLNQPEFEGAKVLNTVMGLTCFEAKGITYLSNLGTREITALPQTEPDFPGNSKVLSSTSLGFDPVKGQYKILKIWSLFGENAVPSKICHKVITLGTSEWRKIDEGFPMEVIGRPVFVDGKLHYLTLDMPSGFVLVAFHVGTEKFEVIEIPEGAAGCETYLFPYRNCLAFVDLEFITDEGFMTMGVLEDYQDRKWEIKVVEMPQGWIQQRFKWTNFQASGISTGEILLTPIFMKGQFYVCRYDMEKKSMKEVEIHGLPHDLHIGQVVVCKSEEIIQRCNVLKTESDLESIRCAVLDLINSNQFSPISGGFNIKRVKNLFTVSNLSHITFWCLIIKLLLFVALSNQFFRELSKLGFEPDPNSGQFRVGFKIDRSR